MRGARGPPWRWSWLRDGTLDSALSDAVRGPIQGFTGKEQDAETGLHYFGARYDMSALARWASADPLADQFPEWNAYNYAVNNPVRYIDPDGELWIAAGHDTYTWVDKCGSGQTCYQSISSVQRNTLIIYGSENAEDITTVSANDRGYVDLNDVAKQHDAAFALKGGEFGAQPFLSLKAASAFFNVTEIYHEKYPESDKLLVTDAGLQDGGAFHGTHDFGRAVDVRYQDRNGRNIWRRYAETPTAADLADVGRTKFLVDVARAWGFNQNYSARPQEFGTSERPGHESHLHLGRNKTRWP